jgi:single-stranded-DNA-specific exonuclease
MAAGLSLAPENINSFRIRLNELARGCLRPEDLQPSLRLDAEVGLEEMTLACLDQLNSLTPTGQGNPAIRFLTRNVTHHRPLRKLGAQKQHVKFWPADGNTVHEAVWWGGGNESLPVGRFDIAFTPQINYYNNSRSVQLKVLDWRQATAP